MVRLRTVPSALALLSAILPPSSQTTHHKDPCAEIYTHWHSGTTESRGYGIDAKVAHECLKTVPYDGERAQLIVEQLHHYFQFFAAQTFYKHPPEYFELQPINTVKSLNHFRDKIHETHDAYKNDLEFNHELMNFFGSYRHGSVRWLPACAGAFIFRHNMPLIAVSPKGPKDDPQIHVVEDPFNKPYIGDEVDKINDISAKEYLSKMTLESQQLKFVDPDARWNDLFFHRINGDARLGVFAQRFIYPDEELTLHFKNGTKAHPKWHARVFPEIVEMGEYGELPWTDSKTFFENVCLAPSDPEKCETGITSVHKRGLTAMSTNSLLMKRTEEYEEMPEKPASMWGYPTPELYTPGHELSLYHTEEYSVIVFSSFDPHPHNTQDGLSFVLDFQDKLWQILENIKAYDKKIGKKRKLIIDLSHNEGGKQILAHESARMLLPDCDHFFLVNRRYSHALKDLMSADFSVNNATLFNPAYYKDEDGNEFESAEDLLGPIKMHHDKFTNFMIPDHDQMVAEVWNQHDTKDATKYWTAKDIVIASDGLCEGACAILLEALQTAHVPVAAFGGRPGKWDMQGAGGLKGHTPAEFAKLAYEIQYILGESAFEKHHLPKPLPVRLIFGSVGLENRFREGNKMPMEFVHKAATWTEKFTQEMFTSASSIWKHTYHLAKGDASTQVEPPAHFGKDEKNPKAPALGSGDDDDDEPENLPPASKSEAAEDNDFLDDILITGDADIYGQYIMGFWKGKSWDETIGALKSYVNGGDDDDDDEKDD